MGNEWNIRRCLMAIYSLLDVNVIPEEDYPEIAEGLSNPHYPVLRRKCMKRCCIIAAIIPRHRSGG